MDFQRYLLIGSIAALSFMLLTEWVQFKEQNSGNNVVAAYQLQQGPVNGDNASRSSEMPNTQTPNGTQIDSNVDIPTFEQESSGNEIAARIRSVE